MDVTCHLPPELLEDARRKWNAFLSAAETAQITLPDITDITPEIHCVWAFSEFVSKSCIQAPDILDSLIRSGDLMRPYRKDEYILSLKKTLSDVRDETTLSRKIRRFRRREMVRIAWRDLAGLAELSETFTELTAFAEACVEEVLSKLYEWQCELYGIPVSTDGTAQRLVVIGMGKLGGMELNFSSDVDLIFAYPDSGHTTAGKTSLANEEFFVRLCQRLIKVLGATTSDGIMFRVDMRLRPYGESGPIVMSFDNMVEYYERQGREWERYAWIKARVIAGDRAAGRLLLKRLKPFIYRRYLDFGAFESLREMKKMISREVQRKGLRENIKLGPGGIREVEFFGQMFQLIRGGVFPLLQETRIQCTLKILADENHIPQKVYEELVAAYRFLRRTENHLQEYEDRQTHEIPADTGKKLRLALSLGFDDVESFSSHLFDHMKRVHSHFDGLLESSDTRLSSTKPGDGLKDIWWQFKDKDRALRMLADQGFKEPAKVLALIEHLHSDPAIRLLTKEGRKRLGKLIPLVLKETSTRKNPLNTLSRILNLIRRLGGRANYLALLLEYPSALGLLVTLMDASPWVASFLTRHPVLLDELLDPRTLYAPPKRNELEAELGRRRSFFINQDLEYQIEELCVFKQVNTLRVAAADIAGRLALMRVSDHLSYIAETILSQVLELAWGHLLGRHGSPACILNGKPCERGFAIIAYGKLGGLELGYDSDLDLVFLHAGAAGQTEGGKQPVDNSQFFARLGQRVVHILTAHTAAGFLYETDMRLRPSGGSGPLVSHIDSFKEYQLNNAWIWEHQALVKARAICGDPALMTNFEKIRRDVLAQRRNRLSLGKDVASMRHRLRKEMLKRREGIFDLRQSAGGMVDIEFLVQYLLLLHAHRFPELTTWTDNVRILGALAKAGIIDGETAHMLRDAYLIFRSALHRLSLEEKPAEVSEDQFKMFRKMVIHLWNEHLGHI